MNICFKINGEEEILSLNTLEELYLTAKQLSAKHNNANIEVFLLSDRKKGIRRMLPLNCLVSKQV